MKREQIEVTIISKHAKCTHDDVITCDILHEESGKRYIRKFKSEDHVKEWAKDNSLEIMFFCYSF